VVEHHDRRPIDLVSLRVTPIEVQDASGAPAYAIRADGPTGSLTYSGDTEWTDALLDAADRVDLFL
jgi:ribonuclease BN (tRNA processing enzyme)